MRVADLKKRRVSRLNTYLSPALRDAIARECLRRGLDLSQFVADGMAEYIGQPDLAERKRLRNIPGRKFKVPAEVSA